MISSPTTFLISTIALLSIASSNALTIPPPNARPVIVGTSDYSNILFGKLQRAASLWGTNLGQPTTIVGDGDKAGKLNDCLWNKFYMASPGSDGVLSQKELVAPLSNWVRNDLKDTLLFLDAVSPKEKGMFSDLPFMKPKTEDDPVPSIDPQILQCAVERECAHIYVLANPDSLETCYAALEPYCSSVPCTILALERGMQMQPSKGWCTSRPQDMEGEFVGPVSLKAFDTRELYFDGPASDGLLPTEDVCEVMIHIALRTDRTFTENPRIVTMGSSNKNAMTERPNEDYFTKTTSQQAGTVLSVASWENFLSPLGQVNAQLGVRPDQQ